MLTEANTLTKTKNQTHKTSLGILEPEPKVPLDQNPHFGTNGVDGNLIRARLFRMLTEVNLLI